MTLLVHWFQQKEVRRNKKITQNLVIGGGIFDAPTFIERECIAMDDLWYKCVFEAERIVKKHLQKIDVISYQIGNFKYKNLYFYSPLLNMEFKKRLYWFVDDAEPTFTPQYLVKVIAEYLDYLLRYGGLENGQN